MGETPKTALPCLCGSFIWIIYFLEIPYVEETPQPLKKLALKISLLKLRYKHISTQDAKHRIVEQSKTANPKLKGQGTEKKKAYVLSLCVIFNLYSYYCLAVLLCQNENTRYLKVSDRSQS
ncbi:hypothetical protein [Nostoc sp.]|uniref:hypothetical protein n=1 Tax=Nostoc sp. TaxID=1180 RepID=UPI002FF7EB7A